MCVFVLKRMKLKNGKIIRKKKRNKMIIKKQNPLQNKERFEAFHFAWIKLSAMK